MTTLVLDRSELELRADGQALALYEAGERRGTVALNLLERIVVQGNVRFESAVLTRLGEAGIATVFLSRRHARRAAFLLGAGHSDAAVRLAQYQLALDTQWCDRWAHRTVMAKIRSQRRMLRQALSQRPDCRKPLTDALASLEGALEKLTAVAGLAATSARGIEGAAAAAYYRGLASLFADSLEFKGRNRRPPRDPVNACLSLGYTLLHFEAVRACHAAGLDALIGFYHRPAFGRESMACDLVEPLRARIDTWVWSLFRQRTLRVENFSRDKGACLLNKTGRSHFYASYEAVAGSLRRHLRRECSVLVRALRKRGEPLLETAEEDEE